MTTPPDPDDGPDLRKAGDAWAAPGAQPSKDVPGPPPPSGSTGNGPPVPGSYTGSYGGSYGYGTPYGGSGMPTQEKGAVTALVLGIVSFVCCGVLLGPAAIFEGTKARRRIRESNGMLTGDGLALAGIICGALGAVVSVFWIVVQIVALQNSNP